MSLNFYLLSDFVVLLNFYLFPDLWYSASFTYFPTLWCSASFTYFPTLWYSTTFTYYLTLWCSTSFTYFPILWCPQLLYIILLRGASQLLLITWTGYPSGAPEFTPVLSVVRVTPSLVLCVCFVDRCLFFCTFSFDHYVTSVLLRFTDSDYPPGIFKLFFMVFRYFYLNWICFNLISKSCNY